MPNLEETALMHSIHTKFAAEIQQAAAGSSVPAEFLAALVANETGGNPQEIRFEKGVLASIWEVLQGRASHFGSLNHDDIFSYVSALMNGSIQPADVGPAKEWGRQQISQVLLRIDSLATSWGLTQIMGYEAIPFRVDVSTFLNPLASLHYTCRLLSMMATGKGLDLTKDFSELFDCWNTGRPNAPTADPRYIPNGLARMAIYRDVAEEAPAPPESA